MSKGKRQAASGGWHRGGDPFEEDHKKQKKKKGKKGGGKRTALIVLGCIAVLAAAVGAAWMIFVKPPDVTDNDRPGVADGPAAPGTTAPSQGDKDKPDEPLSGRKKDYYTFLLLGKDTSSGSTDTIILVSYDVPNQQVNMMSIPRDTAVNVPWTVKKINSVYSAKESSGGGLENLKKQVACLTGVMPDRYVVIEWKAVGEIVDAVDGVEFDVPRNMNYDDPAQDLHIHIQKGPQLLDGKKAMGVIRYRHDNVREDGVMPGYANGDLGRTETQQAFLKAMAKKVLQLGNITKINEFVKIFMDNVETDMTLTEMMWFASKAMGANVDNIQSCTMPNDGGSYFRKGDYVFINIDELLPLVNEQFNPYNQEITADSLQIMVRSKDGSCYVTNGELLDAKWAKPASGSAGTAGGGVTTTEPTGVVADPNAPPPGSSSGGDASAQEPDPPPDENAGQQGEGTGAAAPGATPPDTADPGTTPPDTPDPGTTPPDTADPGTTPPDTTDPGTTPPDTADPTPPPPPPDQTAPEPTPPEDPVPPPDEGSPVV